MTEHTRRIDEVLEVIARTICRSINETGVGDSNAENAWSHYLPEARAVLDLFHRGL